MISQVGLELQICWSSTLVGRFLQLSQVCRELPKNVGREIPPDPIEGTELIEARTCGP